MTTYALLMLPSANRVYAEAAVDLTVAELAVFNATVLDGRLTDLAPTTIGGRALRDLHRADTDRTGRRLPVQRSRRVRPVRARGRPASPGARCARLDQFDDDLITIPKYAGKTNEQFTKLLLNVTLLCSASADRMLDRRLRVLDPLCGRGTTLNQALTYGYDVAGIDLDGKDFEAYASLPEDLPASASGSSIGPRYGPVRREKQASSPAG